MKVVQPLFQQGYGCLTFSISWKSFSRRLPEAHSIPWLVTLIHSAALPWQEQQRADFPPAFLHFTQNLPVWQLETSSAFLPFFFWGGGGDNLDIPKCCSHCIEPQTNLCCSSPSLTMLLDRVWWSLHADKVQCFGLDQGRHPDCSYQSSHFSSYLLGCIFVKDFLQNNSGNCNIPAALYTKYSLWKKKKSQHHLHWIKKLCQRRYQSMKICLHKKAKSLKPSQAPSNDVGAAHRAAAQCGWIKG